MDSCKRFDETSLPRKKKIFTVTQTWKTLQMLIICMPKKVWKDFEIKNLGEDHDLYVQSDTLLLPDVFGSFRNKCIDIHIYNI